MESDNKSLEYFKDWSNYLLVTTVAALGWVTADNVSFSSDTIRQACIWSFASSIVFAIFTLALIPLIAEQKKSGEDIYQVKPDCWICIMGIKLRSVCLPQHLLFLAGILLYAVGTGELTG